MNETDAIGRATFHHIAAQGGVRPTNRALRWLNHIARHGPQSSGYLHELTRDTHRCKDTALRELQKLRAGGLLFLPPRQRQVERAEFNPYIYDLTEKGKTRLRDHGIAVPPRPVSGPWQHQYLTACVTSSIDIATAREGVRYIPQHEILARKGATLGIPVNGGTLIPDQLFALDYGGSYRAFMLEVDRGTEPHDGRGGRKSVAGMLEGYQSAFRRQAVAGHYGLRCPIILLVFCLTISRARAIREWAARIGDPVAGLVVVGVASADVHRRMPSLFAEGWVRVSGQPFALGVSYQHAGRPNNEMGMHAGLSALASSTA